MFRSLTNAKYDNLLVAGKTIAQSFLVNAATRLHPVEWSSGTGAGKADSNRHSGSRGTPVTCCRLILCHKFNP